MPLFSFGQQASTYKSPSRIKVPQNAPPQNVARTTSVEVCNNGVDDDGNGLVDQDDFSCYYNPANNYGCMPSRIIWGCSGPDLYWGNFETGVTRYVGNMNDHTMYDITWASDGKLYGIDNANPILWLIDPNTAQTSAAGQFTGFYGINAMTADNAGNIFIAGKYGNGIDYVGKLNITTMQITPVADLSAAGLVSAGDLSFVNGRLYLSCQGSKLALINTGDGNVQVINLIDSPTPASMGLVTLGSGNLFLSWLDKIFFVAVTVGRVAADPSLDFNNPNINFSGLSNYSEPCNAPDCRASLDVTILSGQPYCSDNGVFLKAAGTGIRGSSAYEWELPNGDIVSDSSLKATQDGMYRVKYYGITDFCGASDSVSLDIIQSPSVSLGNDTMLCVGSSLELKPLTSEDIAAYIWQDGTTGNEYTVSEAGIYSLNVSNSCGTAIDTIVVAPGKVPEVNLGKDVIICPGSETNFLNYGVPASWDVYNWSNGSSAETISVNQPEVYWLQSSNKCGTIRDSVLLSFKDSCTCFPFYPTANLGDNIELCSYETATLKNRLHQNGFHYAWQDGNTNLSVNVKNPGVYWVDVSTYCGTARDSVIVLQKTAGCNRKILVPSAFTPGGNGINDIFKPVIFGVPVHYEFIIYNQWGEVVFRTMNPKEGWDGSINGKKQDTNLFVWTCIYQFEGENKNFQKGNVTLIR